MPLVFLENPGDGDGATCPDDAAFDGSGDLEIIACYEPDDYNPGGFGAGDQEIIARWSSTDASKSFRLNLWSNGEHTFEWYDGSTTQQSNLTTHTNPADGNHQWVRCTLDVSAGDVIWDFSTDSETTDPDSVSWTNETTDNVTTATSVQATSTGLEVGNAQHASDKGFTGQIYYVRVSFGGTPVATFDPNNFEVGDAASDTALDAQGNTWTIKGSATIDSESRVLFIVSDDAAPVTFDQAVEDLLDGTDAESYRSNVVVLADDNDSEPNDYGAYDLVVISESITSGNLATNYSSLDTEAIPVICMEPGNVDELGMASAEATTFSGDLELDGDSHYIADRGVDLDTVSILSAGNTAANQLSELGSGVSTIWKDASEATDEWVIYAYEPGATMDTGTAPDRRVFFGLLSNATFTTKGKNIFLKAVEWALGGGLSKPSPWSWTASGCENSSLASGINMLIPMWEDDDTPTDYSSNSFTATAANSAHWVDGIHGGEIAFVGNTTHSYLEWTSQDLPPDNQTVFSACFIWRNDNSGQVSIIRQPDALTIQHDVSSSDVTRFAIWPGGTISLEDLTDYGTSAADYGDYLVYVFTWDSADNDMDWWVWNLTKNTKSNSTETITPSGTLSQVNSVPRWGSAGSGESMEGSIAFGAYWNRKLSDSEAASLRDDPYQIIRQASTGSMLAFMAMTGS